MVKKDSASKGEDEIESVRKLTVPVNIDSNHTRGSFNAAPITLVESGDCECPYWHGLSYS